jgi:hypothetical protein
MKWGKFLRKRKKKPSRLFREEFGHTPLTLHEDIPWKCKRLVIGTGMEFGVRQPIVVDEEGVIVVGSRSQPAFGRSSHRSAVCAHPIRPS